MKNMNRLEYLIEEIHSEEDMGDGYLKVDVTTNSWGSKNEKQGNLQKEVE